MNLTIKQTGFVLLAFAAGTIAASQTFGQAFPTHHAWRYRGYQKQSPQKHRQFRKTFGNYQGKTNQYSKFNRYDGQQKWQPTNHGNGNNRFYGQGQLNRHLNKGSRHFEYRAPHRQGGNHKSNGLYTNGRSNYRGKR